MAETDLKGPCRNGPPLRLFDIILPVTQGGNFWCVGVFVCLCVCVCVCMCVCLCVLVCENKEEEEKGRAAGMVETQPREQGEKGKLSETYKNEGGGVYYYIRTYSSD